MDVLWVLQQTVCVGLIMVSVPLQHNLDINPWFTFSMVVKTTVQDVAQNQIQFLFNVLASIMSKYSQQPVSIYYDPPTHYPKILSTPSLLAEWFYLRPPPLLMVKVRLMFLFFSCNFTILERTYAVWLYQALKILQVGQYCFNPRVQL